MLFRSKKARVDTKQERYGLLKKITLFFLLTTLALSFSFGSTTDKNSESIVMLSDITIDRSTGNRVYQNQAYTGSAFKYSKDGIVIGEEQFVDGRRHGHIKKWFRNGNVALESYYEKGRRVGETKSWWSNGNLRSLTYYVDDNADGVAWSWYRSGKKFKRYNHLNGHPIGIQQGWRENGKLFSNFEYRNGRTFGLRKSNLCVTLKDEKLQIN